MLFSRFLCSEAPRTALPPVQVIKNQQKLKIKNKKKDDRQTPIAVDIASMLRTIIFVVVIPSTNFFFVVMC
jgi:hypothetical protein